MWPSRNQRQAQKGLHNRVNLSRLWNEISIFHLSITPHHWLLKILPYPQKQCQYFIINTIVALIEGNSGLGRLFLEMSFRRFLSSAEGCMFCLWARQVTDGGPKPKYQMALQWIHNLLWIGVTLTGMPFVSLSQLIKECEHISTIT